LLACIAIVGGSYPQSQLSDITLSWMIRKAKKHGLVFDPQAEAKYLKVPLDNVDGQAHDEWKIIPWGIPEHREIPSVATMANTVQRRLDMNKDYSPENLAIKDGKLSGYSIAQVLPYNEVKPAIQEAFSGRIRIPACQSTPWESLLFPSIGMLDFRVAAGIIRPFSRVSRHAQGGMET
jgi:hypothetical protein